MTDIMSGVMPDVMPGNMPDISTSFSGRQNVR